MLCNMRKYNCFEKTAWHCIACMCREFGGVGVGVDLQGQHLWGETRCTLCWAQPFPASSKQIHCKMWLSPTVRALALERYSRKSKMLLAKLRKKSVRNKAADTKISEKWGVLPCSSGKQPQRGWYFHKACGENHSTAACGGLHTEAGGYSQGKCSQEMRGNVWMC